MKMLGLKKYGFLLKINSLPDNFIVKALFVALTIISLNEDG